MGSSRIGYCSFDLAHSRMDAEALVVVDDGALAATDAAVVDDAASCAERILVDGPKSHTAKQTVPTIPIGVARAALDWNPTPT